MSKAEKFIQNYTSYCSNSYWDKNDGDSNYPWLTPDQTRKAVEIAREETIREVCEWIKSNWMKYHWYDPIEDNEGYNGDRLIEDLKKHLYGKV